MENNDVITKLTTAIAEIDDRICEIIALEANPPVPPEEREKLRSKLHREWFRLTEERGRLARELTLRKTRQQLGTVVKPLTDAERTEFEEALQKVSKHIATGAEINAILESIRIVVTAAGAALDVVD